MKPRTSLLLLCFMTLVMFNSQAMDLGVTRPSHFGVQLVGTRQDASQMNGSGMGMGAEVFLRYPLARQVNLSVGLGFMTASDNVFKTDIQKSILLPSGEVRVEWTLPSTPSFLPFIYAGLHVFNEETKIKVPGGGTQSTRHGFYGALVAGVGAEIPLGKGASRLCLGADYRYAALTSETVKPQYWVGKVGFALDLGRKRSSQDEEGAQEIDAYLSSLEESGADAHTSTPNTDMSAIISRLDLLESLTQANARSIEKIGASMASAPGAAQAVKTPEQTPEFIVPVTVDAARFEAHYKEGLALFRDVKYAQAIALFQALVETNGNHPLASNCYYWIGESYFALGQYGPALEALNRVFGYAESHKLDDALLKEGMCYLNLRQSDQAKTVFQQLLEKYPQSEYVSRANGYLNEL